MAVRILLADDSEVARGLLRDIVTARAEWEICGEALDGRQAIEKATELKPDVILMDLAMPKMDGLTASRAIRKLLPGTPIILVSLHNMPQVELMAKNAGIEKVVWKNEADTALVQAIEDALRERAARAAAAAAGSGAQATSGETTGNAGPSPTTAPQAGSQPSEISNAATPTSEPKKEENGDSQAS